jgi:hypothetical protein
VAWHRVPAPDRRPGGHTLGRGCHARLIAQARYRGRNPSQELQPNDGRHRRDEAAGMGEGRGSSTPLLCGMRGSPARRTVGKVTFLILIACRSSPAISSPHGVALKVDQAMRRRTARSSKYWYDAYGFRIMPPAVGGQLPFALMGLSPLSLEERIADPPFSVRFSSEAPAAAGSARSTGPAARSRT